MFNLILIYLSKDYTILCFYFKVRLVTDLLKKQIEVCKVIFSNVEYGTFFNRSVAHEMSSILEVEPVENKLHRFGNY